MRDDLPDTGLYKNHHRCPSCEYWADKKEWSVIKAGSNDGYSKLEYTRYSTVDKKSRYEGTVDLLVCPNCKTVIALR